VGIPGWFAALGCGITFIAARHHSNLSERDGTLSKTIGLGVIACSSLGSTA